MVVARTAEAHRALTEAMAARAVERHYVALVWGVPTSPRGVIDAPIGRSVRRRTRMAVRASGRDARTAYTVREVLDEGRRALLDCALETGRTHQIRVHLSSIGHPVVGDAAYGGLRAGSGIERPFLHARSIAFEHPTSGARIEIDEPLPVDLQTLLDRLRSGSPDSAGAAG
jgi:23S rRNA pseudouridine1911/1915/1917 synthase